MTPLRAHVNTREAMSVGLLTKNGSRIPARVPHCHRPMATAATTTCQARTADRDGTRPSDTRPRFALTLDHFLPKIGPDRSIEIDERGVRSEIEQFARALERDPMT